MLQDFRDNLKGITTWFLVAIIIVPFALFGVDSLFLTGSSVNEVASVDGEGITELRLRQAIDLRKRQLMEQYEQLTPDLLDDEQLRGPVLDGLIRQKVIALAADNQGMATPADTINEIISKSPAFQNEGRFDRDVYQFSLRRMGYSPKSYREILSTEILGQQFVRGVVDTSFVTKAELGELISIREQTRDYSYLTLPLGPVLDTVNVEEAEIAAFYEGNADRFQVPQRIVVEYVEIEPDAFAADISVDEALIREQYQQQIQAIRDNAQKRVAHILIASGDAETLQKIQSELANGGDFAELARKYSTDSGSAEQGGDLGIASPGAFPEAFEKALDELSVGEVSPPVKTDSGYHFIKLLESTETDIPGYEEEKSRIESTLRRQLAIEQLPEKIEQLKELSYNVSSLQTTADAMGLALKVSEPFSRSGGTGPLSSIPQAVRAAFDEAVLERGYSSDVLELSDEHFLVLKLRELQPAHRKGLDEVRDQIVASLKGNKARAILEERAKQLQQRLDAGETIDTIAAAESLDWQDREKIKRYAAEDYPRLVNEIFGYPQSAGLPQSGILAVAQGDYVVYALTGIESGDDSQVSEDDRRQLAVSLSEVSGGREFQAYVSSLEAEADIARKSLPSDMD